MEGKRDTKGGRKKSEEEEKPFEEAKKSGDTREVYQRGKQVKNQRKGSSEEGKPKKE